MSNEGPWQDESLVKRVKDKQRKEHQPVGNGQNAVDEKVESQPAQVAAAPAAAAIGAGAATHEESAQHAATSALVSEHPDAPRSAAHVPMTVVESKVDS